MGVNTLTYLPATTDLGDLTLAIQRLTDADNVRIVARQTFQAPSKVPTGTVVASASRGDQHAHDSGFDLYIERKDGFGDGVDRHSGSVYLNSGHYGNDYVEGARYTYKGICIYGGNASAFWASLGDALVNVFGGIVDYNDCDSEAENTRKNATRHANVGDGDERWTATQKFIQNLTTVTDEQRLKRYDRVVGIYNRKGEYRERSSWGADKGKVRVYHEAAG